MLQMWKLYPQDGDGGEAFHLVSWSHEKTLAEAIEALETWCIYQEEGESLDVQKFGETTLIRFRRADGTLDEGFFAKFKEV